MIEKLYSNNYKKNYKKNYKNNKDINIPNIPNK